MKRAALHALFFVSSAVACGTTETAPADSGSQAIPEPQRHRPTAAACDPNRPPTTPEPSASGCKSDAECAGDGGAKNARCVFDLLAGGNRCSVDECQTDADCGQARVCACRLTTNFGANRCLNAACRTDGDCGVVGKGFCSPSGDNVFANCPLKEPGSLGYFCHAPGDECSNDSDCGALNAFCLFSPAKSHFACVALSCTK